MEIAREIRARARTTPRGSVTWVGPEGYGTELSPLVVRQLGPDIHHGTTGLALFLAAVARAEGGGEWAPLSLAAVAPLRRKLAAMVATGDPSRVRLGGFKGLGSFIYGLLTIGRLLDEPALVAEAHRATALITPERIAQDTQVRVQTGCAGTILALLALHAAAPGANAAGRTPLDLARDCAAHLLATRGSDHGGPRVWALSPGMPPLLGFAYGAAGICHALLRLHGATGEAETREAAREGLEFVRGLYSPAHGRWWDPRALLEARHRLRRGTWTDFWYGGSMDDLEPLAPDEQEAAGAVAAGPADGQRLPRLWCHGSSGILLGKMATLDLDGGAEVRQEIGDGLEDLCRYAADEDAPGETDDLCCGRMGPAEALLYAHGRLGDARYLAAARALVARAWLRRRREGRYAVSAARGRDLFAPYLLHGLAGIGYTYLRLAMPRDLPCLVLLE